MTSAVPVGTGLDDLRRVQDEALALTGPASLDPLLERIGDARYVLIGEASHGTADFYRWRAMLTRRLIEEKHLSFVAVEGDWPDCQAAHCSVTATPGAPAGPREALENFRRWPRWMCCRCWCGCAAGPPRPSPPTGIWRSSRPGRGRPQWYQQEHEHRAIGVVYRPEHERWGNYVPTLLGERYDAFCHLDRTTALTPPHAAPMESGEEEPWPIGM